MRGHIGNFEFLILLTSRMLDKRDAERGYTRNFSYLGLVMSISTELEKRTSELH